LLSEEDRATATVIMYRKFGKIRTVAFEIIEWTDKQTDRHTDMLIAILRSSHAYHGRSKTGERKTSGMSIVRIL